MAYSFDPASPPDYLEYGDQTLFDGLGEMTFHAVVWTNNVTADHYIWSKNDSSFNGIIFFIDDSSPSPATDTYALFLNNGTAARIEGGTGSAIANQWQTVTGAFTIGGTNGEMWVDGVKGTSANTTAFTGGMTNNSNPARIGIDHGPTTTRGWDGEIAEMTIWNRKLSDAEITFLHAGYSAAFIPRGRLFFAPLVGDPNDVHGLTATEINNPAKAPHPRIIMPSAEIIQFPPSTAPPAARRRFMISA